MRKRRFGKRQILKFGVKVAVFLFRSQLLTVFLALFALGFWAGKSMQPEAGAMPYEELFDNLSVLSFRETPSDSCAHFLVELSAGGRVFRQYDIDAHRLVDPVRGHDYRRSISGTQYRPLRVRGHVARGFWLELPGSSLRTLLPEQFNELYRSTLDYVKPVSIASSIVGTLSGYSMGYRAATWSHSLLNPAVQQRVLETPGIQHVLAREAWRRVLLEPVVMGDENDAGRFAAVRGTQRIYTNFFKLALNDSDGFIPREATRLDSAGFVRESRAMRAFAQAARRAQADTCDLASRDFDAIEEWASLLDRQGHWAPRATPPAGEERMRYFGTLSWYGLAPPTPDERRIWIGPRVLVREGDTEGFIADEIPSTPVGCPAAWREWMRGDRTNLGASAWTARWLGPAREFAPVIRFGRRIVGRWRASR